MLHLQQWPSGLVAADFVQHSREDCQSGLGQAEGGIDVKAMHQDLIDSWASVVASQNASGRCPAVSNPLAAAVCQESVTWARTAVGC